VFVGGQQRTRQRRVLSGSVVVSENYLVFPHMHFVVNALNVVDQPSLVSNTALASFFAINSHVHLHVSIMAY